MSGTSLDGLDVALVEIEGTGLAMRARYVGMVSRKLEEVGQQLRKLAEGQAVTAADQARLARALGELHAEAVADLCQQLGGRLDLISAHGQTVWHGPSEGLSVQLLDPWPMVRRLGVAVVHDLRQADLIAGGQGAPITPTADWVMFRSQEQSRLIVNLGGICNVTELAAGCEPHGVRGEDIGPCNLLIDGVVATLFPPKVMDTDGEIAKKGQAQDWVWSEVCQAAFFRRARPRTTGREDFSAAWVKELVAKAGAKMTREDVVASATWSAAKQVAEHAETMGPNVQVVLAGGGARNPVLVEIIERFVSENGQRVLTTAALGVPVEAREAAAMAVLGALAEDGQAITLPQVTGVKPPGQGLSVGKLPGAGAGIPGAGRAGRWVYP